MACTGRDAPAAGQGIPSADRYPADHRGASAGQPGQRGPSQRSSRSPRRLHHGTRGPASTTVHNGGPAAVRTGRPPDRTDPDWRTTPGPSTDRQTKASQCGPTDRSPTGRTVRLVRTGPRESDQSDRPTGPGGLSPDRQHQQSDRGPTPVRPGRTDRPQSGRDESDRPESGPGTPFSRPRHPETSPPCRFSPRGSATVRPSVAAWGRRPGRGERGNGQRDAGNCSD